MEPQCFHIILLAYTYEPWKIQTRKDMVSVSFVFGERCEKIVSPPRIFKKIIARNFSVVSKNLYL